MNLLVVGINHKSAPLELRERVCISKDERDAFIPILQEKYFNECLIVTTCNRTEIYGITKKADTAPDEIISELLQFKNASDIDRKYFFYYRNEKAVRHLFSVASGADSMVTGDIQILCQIKDAFHASMSLCAEGPFLKRLKQSTCRIGKRSRRETSISEGTVSVSYAAVELLHRSLGSLENKTALLIGAGKTGRLTAKHLTAKGIGQLYLANRTASKVDSIIEETGGTYVPFDEILTAMEQADIVLTAVDCVSPIITRFMLEKIMMQRSDRTLYIVDIGLPRNIAPDATGVANIRLWDMDALSEIVENNRLQRLAEVKKVERIIDEEWTEFDAWENVHQVGPTIFDLNTLFEDIRQNEVTKYRHRFDEPERELVELITRRIVNKLLHKPMVNLKHDAGSELQHQHENSLRKLFELNRSGRN
ncbi:glutamyl-tRNA reductase [bacterium]|nr:glutamyl-tRNA reductase [bacterium]